MNKWKCLLSTENCRVACGMQPLQLQHSAAAASLNVFLSRCFMSQSTVICTLKARLVVPMWIVWGGGDEGSWGRGYRFCSPAICSICIKSQEALRINRPLGMPIWHIQSAVPGHGLNMCAANGLIAQFAYLFRVLCCCFVLHAFPLDVANPIARASWNPFVCTPVNPTGKRRVGKSNYFFNTLWIPLNEEPNQK